MTEPTLAVAEAEDKCEVPANAWRRQLDHVKERLVRTRIFAATAFVALAFAAPAFAADYQTNLGPMPLDDETKAVIGGRGDATASYDGKTFVVKGDFKGMPSNATSAHVFSSPRSGDAGAPSFSILKSPSPPAARSQAASH